MTKWLELLEKGDKIYFNNDKSFYTFKYWNDEKTSVWVSGLGWIYSKDIDFQKTGLELIKRLWNEGKLKSVILNRNDYGYVFPNGIYFEDSFVKSDDMTICTLDEIDTDKTLSEYMNVKEITDKQEILKKFNSCDLKGKVDKVVGKEINLFGVDTKIVVNGKTGYIQLNGKYSDNLPKGHEKKETLTSLAKNGNVEAMKDLFENNAKKFNKDMQLKQPTNIVTVTDSNFAELDGQEYVNEYGVKFLLTCESNWLNIHVFLTDKNTKCIANINTCLGIDIDKILKETGLQLNLVTSAREINTCRDLFLLCEELEVYIMFGEKANDTCSKFTDVDGELSIKEFEEKYIVKISNELKELISFN